MWLLAALLAAMMFLSGCARTEIAVKPPACPAMGAELATEFSRLNEKDYPAIWGWLPRLKTHCDQVEVLRK